MGFWDCEPEEEKEVINSEKAIICKDCNKFTELKCCTQHAGMMFYQCNNCGMVMWRD